MARDAGQGERAGQTKDTEDDVVSAGAEKSLRYGKKKYKRAEGAKKLLPLIKQTPTHTHSPTSCLCFVCVCIGGHVGVCKTNEPRCPTPTAVIYNTSKKALRAVRASSALQMHFIASEPHKDTHKRSHPSAAAIHTHTRPCAECLGFVPAQSKWNRVREQGEARQKKKTKKDKHTAETSKSVGSVAGTF